MRRSPPLLKASDIEDGLRVVTSLGPGLVVADFTGAISIPSMTLEGWSVFFVEIAERARTRDVHLAVRATPATIDIAREVLSPAGVSVIARSSPGSDAMQVAALAEHVVAVWAVPSIKNARLARKLRVPLVDAGWLESSWRSRWSHRIARRLLAAPSQVNERRA